MQHHITCEFILCWNTTINSALLGQLQCTTQFLEPSISQLPSSGNRDSAVFNKLHYSTMNTLSLTEDSNLFHFKNKRGIALGLCLTLSSADTIRDELQSLLHLWGPAINKSQRVNIKHYFDDWLTPKEAMTPPPSPLPKPRFSVKETNLNFPLGCIIQTVYLVPERPTFILKGQCQAVAPSL